MEEERWLHRIGICLGLLIFAGSLVVSLSMAGASELPVSDQKLSPRNLEAPFCYLHGSTRRWPILSGRLTKEDEVTLTARRGGEVLGSGEPRRARGEKIEFSGLTVSVTREGGLRIGSRPEGENLSFELEVALRHAGGQVESQRLEVRPAPPQRPVAYYSDFADDVISIFLDYATGKYRPIEKSGFDQYFRRMQAHGVSRLILWLSSFPLFADPSAYTREDWSRYEGQAQAILKSEELTEALAKRSGFTSWGWLRELFVARQTPRFINMVTQSAADHGISLAVSFRPFEAAVSKYYEIPTFDADGKFLWWYLPLSSPAVNFHADQVGFAHYRTILSAMGSSDYGEIDTIRVADPQNTPAFLKRFEAARDNLKIVASAYPPMQSGCFVLQRQTDGSFKLRRFRELQAAAESQCLEITGYRITTDPKRGLLITGLKIPSRFRYLLLTNAAGRDNALDLPVEQPVTLWSKAGTPLGRENVYWSLDESNPESNKTRVAGITADGEYYTEFYATENSADYLHGSGQKRMRLSENTLVIDRGDPYSFEMVDFNRPAARAYAVKELKVLLSHPPIREIFINTRSHTQLSAHEGDGEKGLRPLVRYRAERLPYYHLGIDRAYAPRSVASAPKLRELANADSVARITTWQHGEWAEPCQTPDSPYAWRYARNVAVAKGVRSLLKDLEVAFPKTRIQVVLPEREAATRRVKEGLANMPKPAGGFYGRDYYHQIWASINHIESIGEGMSMVDLGGLGVEPVFLGIRLFPEREPMKLFVKQCFADLADNHGSSFHGARSFFYEGHEMLHTSDPAGSRRAWEERMCYLLSQKKEVREVILYEACDWLYNMPLSDPEGCSYGFLDRSEEILKAGGW